MTLMKGRGWSSEDSDKLLIGYAEYGPQWRIISEKYFDNTRKTKSLSQHWKVLERKYECPWQKKTFEMEQKDIFFDAIRRFGEDWESISKEYFDNHISPDELFKIWETHKEQWMQTISRKGMIWTQEEEERLLIGYGEYGPDWKIISKEYFNFTRSPSSLKIHWLSRVQHKYDWTSKPVQNQENQPKKEKKEPAHKTYILKHQEKCLLITAVRKFGTDWPTIARKYFSYLYSPQLLHKEWEKLKEEMNKSGSSGRQKLWTHKEDKLLRYSVSKYGEGNWSKMLPLFKKFRRTDLATRWRSLKDAPLIDEEHEEFLALFETHGKDWEKISKGLFRPIEEVKNHYQLLEEAWKSLKIQREKRRIQQVTKRK
ncbi:hypothetical protein G9A89_006176 [Geosiphon pyriformis]|nr:hypothetical protein G9A89_006176 [Geosiphon pyriformis]